MISLLLGRLGQGREEGCFYSCGGMGFGGRHDNVDDQGD